MTVMDVPSIEGADALLEQLEKNVLRISRDGRAAVIMDSDLYEELIESLEDLEDIRAALEAEKENSSGEAVRLEDYARSLGIEL